jgi:hypothetical protein
MLAPVGLFSGLHGHTVSACQLSVLCRKGVKKTTYGTAIVRDAPRRAKLQNMRSNICVKAVFPRFEMRDFLSFVTRVG